MTIHGVACRVRAGSPSPGSPGSPGRAGKTGRAGRTGATSGRATVFAVFVLLCCIGPVPAQPLDQGPCLKPRGHGQDQDNAGGQRRGQAESRARPSVEDFELVLLLAFS